MSGNLPSIKLKRGSLNNNIYNYKKFFPIGYNKKNIYQNYQNLSLEQKPTNLSNVPNFSIDSNLNKEEIITNKNTTQITYYKKGSMDKSIFNYSNNKIPESIYKYQNKNPNNIQLNNFSLKSYNHKEIIQRINNQINKNTCFRNSNLLLPEVLTEKRIPKTQKRNSFSFSNKENNSNNMNINQIKNINNNSPSKVISLNHGKIELMNIPRAKRGKTLTAINILENKKRKYTTLKENNLSNQQKLSSSTKNEKDKEKETKKDLKNLKALYANIKNIKGFFNVKNVNLFLNNNNNSNNNDKINLSSTLICPICNKDIENYKYQYHLGLHPSKILDWLYLGSYRNAYDKKDIKNLGINYVLNCAVECKERFPPDIKYCHLKLRDHPHFRIINYLDRATDFINQAQNDKGIILVHCQLGISRSTTCVIAYFIKYLGYTAISALNFIRTKRTQVMPNFGFLNQLKTYERNNRNNGQK